MSGLLGTVIVPHHGAGPLFDGHKGVLKGLRTTGTELKGPGEALGIDPARAGRRWRSRVGIVWQDESAPAELTVRETVAHFARYYPRPRDCEDVIALVGLEQKAGARIKELSGGQRRRLDVTLGVIDSPELLLLDEPTTGFDPGARRRFWELIRLPAREGTTIVLTTHYLEEAEALAGRLAVISAAARCSASRSAMCLGPVVKLPSSPGGRPCGVWRLASVRTRR
ncbi:ATP-binding cassette domain-containing protein, partial [Streptomyces sp. NPDC058240]|uniref:ATP-binding cassette domain-containing protein n=1 Tax=Streptomyces sp. NPDC058240 TaxID=3346396 RepID=UPI0036F0CED2